MEPLSQTAEYKQFRSLVPLNKISIGNINEKVWKYYDHGPKDVEPLICLPGAGGTAEVFYKQILSLCARGYRVISVQYAPYETHQLWCKGFDRFLEKIGTPEKVHIFGTALGGYLAQCYAQYRSAKVGSLILNNAFCDTTHFHDNAPCVAVFNFMPEFILKRFILQNFPQTATEAQITQSVDFMVEQLETLSKDEVASRLTLNCTIGPLKPAEITLNQEYITILDTLDDVALPDSLREDVYKYYAGAKIANLKTGGNFAYLSRADEVNLHLQVHLRKLGVNALKASDGAGPDAANAPADTTEAHTTSDSVVDSPKQDEQAALP